MTYFLFVYYKMDCKDFICVIVIYLLIETIKTRFSRENFTRKNNDSNLVLQDGNGNIQMMKVKDIYDAIEKAKQEAVSAAARAVSQNVSTNKIDVHQGINIKGGTHKHGWQSHFPWSDGKNYIRGPTIIDGDVTINGTLRVWGKYIPIFQGDMVSLRARGNNRYVNEDRGKVNAHKTKEERLTGFTINKHS